MEIYLDEILNKHKEEPCLILGSGKSLHEINYEKFKGKIIAVGTTILRIKERKNISYFVSANNHFPIPEIKDHLDFLNNLKNTTWLMSDTAAYNDIWVKNHSFLKNNLKINWLSFDDRHFNGKQCNPRKECCKIIENKNSHKTLQEFFFEKKAKKNAFFKAISVAEFGIIFAILFGCNPIYLAGIDIPKKNYWAHSPNRDYYGFKSEYADNFLNKTNKIIKKKYFNYYVKNINFFPYIKSAYLQLMNKVFKKSFFSFDLDKFEKNFKEITKIAKENNQQIINLGNSDIIKQTDGIKSLKIKELS
jgi:hypothetical protein